MGNAIENDLRALPYGHSIADITAHLHGRRPTDTEVEQEAQRVYGEFGAGNHVFTRYPDEDIRGYLKTVMIEHGIKVKELSDAVGVTETTVSRWRGDLTRITFENFVILCKGLVKVCSSDEDAWRALYDITLALSESNRYVVDKNDEAKREVIQRLVVKLDGAALDSVYLHTVALAEALPYDWRRKVKKGADITETQRAVIQVNATNIAAANEDLRTMQRSQNE